MLGSSCARLMTYVMVGAIALSMGSQLLISATGIVLSWRLGNPMPLLMILALTIFTLRLSAVFDSESMLNRIIGVLGWAAAIYLAFTVLLIAIPMGFVSAIFSCSLVVVGCGFIQNPTKVINLASGGSLTGAITRSGLRRSPLRNGDTVWDSIKSLSLEVFIVPSDGRDKAVTILKERPILPVSLTHLEDVDVVVVDYSDDEKWITRVQKVFADEGVVLKGTRDSFRQTVVALPLIEIGHGISLSDYRVVVDPATVEHLLKIWPVRMTVHPGTNGLRVVVTADSASGFKVMKIPRGLEGWVVVARDLKQIEEKGEDDIGNSA